MQRKMVRHSPILRCAHKFYKKIKHLQENNRKALLLATNRRQLWTIELVGDMVGISHRKKAYKMYKRSWRLRAISRRRILSVCWRYPWTRSNWKTQKRWVKCKDQFWYKIECGTPNSYRNVLSYDNSWDFHSGKCTGGIKLNPDRFLNVNIVQWNRESALGKWHKHPQCLKLIWNRVIHLVLNRSRIS